MHTWHIILVFKKPSHFFMSYGFLEAMEFIEYLFIYLEAVRNQIYVFFTNCILLHDFIFLNFWRHFPSLYLCWKSRLLFTPRLCSGYLTSKGWLIASSKSSSFSKDNQVMRSAYHFRLKLCILFYITVRVFMAVMILSGCHTSSLLYVIE